MANNRNYRTQVLDIVSVVASPSEQLSYESKVPIANVLEELLCSLPFFPKDSAYTDEFTHEELLDIAELFGTMCLAAKVVGKQGIYSVSDILNNKEWGYAVACAKDLEVRLKNE